MLCLYMIGRPIFDYNKQLILLSVIPLSGRHLDFFHLTFSKARKWSEFLHQEFYEVSCKNEDSKKTLSWCPHDNLPPSLSSSPSPTFSLHPWGLFFRSTRQRDPTTSLFTNSSVLSVQHNELEELNYFVKCFFFFFSEKTFFFISQRKKMVLD